MALALKNVQFFKAREINSSPLTIKLSGLAFHRTLAVLDISTVQDGDSLQVLVCMTPVKRGLSGNFSYDLLVPDAINTVSFGKEKAVIWRRDVGFVNAK